MDETTALIRRLAIAAGAAIMAVRAGGDLGTRAKADASPVTRADEAADAIIWEGLRAADPGTPIVTEERAASHGMGGGAGIGAGRFWIVDPLDGTKDFAAGRDGFTVNIALVEGGAPVRGVVLAPAAGRLFYTDGGAAFEEVAGPESLGQGGFGAAPGAMRRLQAGAPDPGALRVVASKSHRDAATDAYIARLPAAGIVAAGSSLKFCLVAAGEADIYPRLGPTMEWDTAAGDAVLRAAGGMTARAEDLAPLAYGKPGHANPAFVAHAPGAAPVPA